MLIMPINGYFLHNGPQSGQGLTDSSESKVKHGTYNPATETNGQTTYYFQKKKPRAICSYAGRCRTPSWHRRQHPQRGGSLSQRLEPAVGLCPDRPLSAVLKWIMEPQ